MKKFIVVGLPLLSCVALLMTITSVPVTGQVKKGKERPMTTEQLMEGLVKPFCTDLGKGINAAPADDKSWKSLAVKAALLNEAGYILMADGRCPDKVWADASKALSDHSASVLKAISAKDAAAAKSAFGAMTKACGACHKKHKK